MAIAHRFLALALLLQAVPHTITAGASPVDTGRQQVIGVDDEGKTPANDIVVDSTVSDATHDGPGPGVHTSKRKLRGKFLHITDFHPDDFYAAHTSTSKNVACHRGKGPSGYYGAETTDCDSPFSLVNATFDWISENLADDIDFVVWTGDTARHDSDEKIPRNRDQVLDTNRRVADKFYETFKDPNSAHRMRVPVIPNFGNNDILPHNILYPGPTKWLHYYTDIWRHFIPEEQRHSFDFGGWFSVEVVPNKLAVFSLNTLYLFDRNAAVDGCLAPDEPGFKQMDWLRVQLQLLRERGMKAILMGHVPPARTNSKQNWDETCWQKYNLWMRQYRDVVVSSLWGHMNIDHFIAHDTHDINLGLLTGQSELTGARATLEDEFSVTSATDYLKELRKGWSNLPKPGVSALDEDEDDEEDEYDDIFDLFVSDEEAEMTDETDDAHAEKKHRGKDKKGRKKKKKKLGKFAQRYHVSLISPSIVPNYFPTLRVFEYNISGMEDSPVWRDSFDAKAYADTAYPILDDDDDDKVKTAHSQDLKRDFDAEGKKGKKGKKKPKDPNMIVPNPPAKSSPPGPAYSPQPLTLLGYTQYFANLTYINNDMTDDDEAEADKWREGIHRGEKPDSKPEPKAFKFEVEYSTFTDKIYKLKDLTVRSYVKLAYRIGQQPKSKGAMRGEDFEVEGEEEEDDEDDEGSDPQSQDEDEEDGDMDDGDEEASIDGGKKKKKKHKKKKNNNKVWLHFLRHAFVETVPKKKLKKF